MRRPPCPIPSATDRTPPEPRAATPSVGGHVQRTVTRPVGRRRNDGRGRRRHGAVRTARQPAEHRVRDQETTAKRQKVRVHISFDHRFRSYGTRILFKIHSLIRLYQNNETQYENRVQILFWKITN